MVSYQIKQPLNINGSGKRTPGVHLSGILRPLAFSLGWLDKKWDTEETIPELISRCGDDPGQNGNLMRLVLGMAVEEWLAKQLTSTRSGFVHQPGEFSLDDIYGNPDGLECDGDGYLVHEIKGTHKSSRKPVQDQSLWIWQGACYCRILSEHFKERITRCIFHPFYIRGDYSGIEPKYCPTLVVWEWEEIMSMWAVVVEHKHLAVPERGQS